MTETKKVRLLAIVGATASGKSAVAVELAKKLDGEIVSCDSMQVYRGMNVGTAKPTAEEMGGIAHHLIDVADADENFNCADYVTLAQKAIEDICSRGKLPILCGGTGLYLDSLLRGGFEETQSDPALRQGLFDYAAAHGNHALHERLREVDPESADAIHENNVKRVVRALEIYESTGMTKTEADRRTREIDPPYDATVIGLNYPEREILYGRIDRRVDEMLANGLLEETRGLYEAGVFEQNATAAQAIGYKELLGVLEGTDTLEGAVEALKRATRRYAKRQITWFSAKPYVKWIDMTEQGEPLPLAAIVEKIMCHFIQNKL